jgi:hypothetical protein
MNRKKHLSTLVLACVGIAVATTAMAKVRHKQPAPPYTTQWSYAPGYPDAVYVGGTYAGADPDPNIRAALIREFGRRR